MNEQTIITVGNRLVHVSAGDIVPGALSIQVEDAGGVSVFTDLSAVEAQGLRKYFEQERDRELGRWRCPTDSKYVVTPAGELPEHGINVTNERNGFSLKFSRHAVFQDMYYKPFADVALAYFAAHPEPKPWHDAANGEVWLVKVDGVTRPALVLESVDGLCFYFSDSGGVRTLALSDPRVEEAERAAVMYESEARAWGEEF